jgi:hypothetical protein
MGLGKLLSLGCIMGLVSVSHAAAGSNLYAVTAVNHLHVKALIKSEAEVLYHHKTFAVVAASSNQELPVLSAAVETSLRAFNSSRRYFVLRAKNLTTESDSLKWASQIQSNNRNITVLYHDEHYLVASADPVDFATREKEDAESDEIYDKLALPKHTHYNPLTTRGLTMKQHLSAAKIENATSSTARGAHDKGNPIIERMIEDVSSERMAQFIDLISNQWNSRQAATPTARDAAVLLREEFVSLGFDTELEEFSDIYSPNVVAKKLGTVNPDSWVVIGGESEFAY